MTETINYSIIIPHKNIPDLLQRCLDSIPRRKDVQIIVVDDNSDKSIVDFDNFPGLNDPYVEVYFTKKGKGAGYARNVGLEHAKGKWVLFADADDMFMDVLSNVLDKNIQNIEDVVLYTCLNKNEFGEILFNPLYNRGIDDALRIGDYNSVLFEHVVPYGKIVRKVFLDAYKIKFQEVMYSNDVMYSLQLARYAKNIRVEEESIYIVIDRKGSLSRNSLWESDYVRTKVALKAYSFIEDLPMAYSMTGVYNFFWKNLFHKKKMIAIFMIPRILWHMGLRCTIKNLWINLQKDYPKYFK